MAMNTDANDTVVKPRRRCRRILAMILLAVFVVSWFVWGPLAIISYVGAVFNSMRGFMILLPLTLAVVGSVPAFPMLVVHTAVTWRRWPRSHRRTLIFWIVLTGGFACPYLIGLAGLTPSPFDAYVRGFTRYAKSQADVGAIQSWLTALDPNDYKEPGVVLIERILEDSEQPSSVARLHPKMAKLLLDDSGHLAVRLLWGGGLIGHWGLVIGHEDMPISPPDSSEYTEYHGAAFGRNQNLRKKTRFEQVVVQIAGPGRLHLVRRLRCDKSKETPMLRKMTEVQDA